MRSISFTDGLDERSKLEIVPSHVCALSDRGADNGCYIYTTGGKFLVNESIQKVRDMLNIYQEYE